MLKVGLTGSIAVGKSFVCRCFADFGIHVLDADLTAREVVAPGTSGLSEIVRSFGESVLARDGSLDRKKLASIVFSDPGLRELLNSIVHPLVIARQNDWLEELRSADPNGVAIIDAALMIESGGYKRFNKLIVVWCEPEIQLHRLMERDGLSKDEAELRIAAQMSQETKKSFADILIDTSAGFEKTRDRVADVADELLLAARTGSG
ncbi:MAG: dephospho-CoA kinase [Acidobacteria bacterium]|nr:dephospho-CoA kinase [Acidobacteriota bacterium]MCW5947910.1 dephospho-CoA kinase [Pyrinomonadaceae bacterium]